MPLEVASGTFLAETTSPTSNVPYPSTPLSFDPKIVFFLAGRNTGNGVNAIHSRMVGFLTASTVHCVSFAGFRHPAGNEGQCITTNLRCIRFQGTQDSEPELLSGAQAGTPVFSGGQFRLTWNAADGVARRVHWVAVGGSTLSNVNVGTFQSPTSIPGGGPPAVALIDTLSYTPDCVGIFTASHAATLLQTQASSGQSLGWGTEALVPTENEDRQWEYRTTGGTSATLRTRRGFQRGFIQRVFNASGSQRWLSFLDQINSDGFRLNYGNNIDGNNNYFIWVTMKGALFRAGVDVQPTSDGDAPGIDVGFAPKAAFFGSHCNVVDTTILTQAAGSYGQVGGVNSDQQMAVFSGGIEGSNPADYSSEVKDNRVILMRTTSGNGTVNSLGEARWVTPDGNKFVLNWSGVDGTQRRFGYFVIGEPAGGTPILASRVGGEESLTALTSDKTGGEESPLTVTINRVGGEESLVALLRSLSGAEESLITIGSSRIGAEESLAELLVNRNGGEESKADVSNVQEGAEESLLPASNNQTGAEESNIGVGVDESGAEESVGVIGSDSFGAEESVFTPSIFLDGAEESLLSVSNSLLGAEETLEPVGASETGAEESELPDNAIAVNREGGEESLDELSIKFIGQEESLLAITQDSAGVEESTLGIQTDRIIPEESEGIITSPSSGEEESEEVLGIALGGAEESLEVLGVEHSGAEESSGAIQTEEVGAEESEGYTTSEQTGAQESRAILSILLSGAEESLIGIVSESGGGQMSDQAMGTIGADQTGGEESRGLILANQLGGEESLNEAGEFPPVKSGFPGPKFPWWLFWDV
jgi:hypothetical protein